MENNNRKPKIIIFWPSILVVLVGGIYGLLNFSQLFVLATVPKIDFLANASLTSAITILGFLIAVITFIISASDAPVMQYIIKYNGDKELWQYFLQPFLSGLICIICSVLLIISSNENNQVMGYIIAIFIIPNAAFLLSVIQTTVLIFKILKNIIRDKKKNKLPVETKTPDEFFV